MKCPKIQSHGEMVLKEELRNSGAFVWYCKKCKVDFIVEGVITRVMEPFIVSNPPPGYLQIRNLYVDPATGKIVVRYTDEEL